MKIGSKILVLSALGVVAIGALGTADLASAGRVRASNARVRDVLVPQQTALAELQFCLLRYHTTTIRTVLSSDPTELRGLRDEYPEINGCIAQDRLALSRLGAAQAYPALWARLSDRYET